MLRKILFILDIKFLADYGAYLWLNLTHNFSSFKDMFNKTSPYYTAIESEISTWVS